MNFKKTLQAAAVGAALFACSSVANAGIGDATCKDLVEAAQTEDGALAFVWCVGYVGGRLGVEEIPDEAAQGMIQTLAGACQEAPDEQVVNLLELIVQGATEE